MAVLDWDKEFEAFWSSVWRKTAKGAAKKAYERARKKTSAETIIQGAKKFGRWLKAENKGPQFWPHPATWLNQERWDDDLEIKTPPTPVWGKSDLDLQRQRDDWALEQKRSADATAWLESLSVDEVDSAFNRIVRRKGLDGSRMLHGISWRTFPSLVAEEMGWRFQRQTQGRLL